MSDHGDWLAALVAAIDLPARRDGSDLWVGVPSSMRGSLAVRITPGERTVTFRAFVMRAPDRRHEDVYRRLLRRNDQAGPWMFSIDAPGDVFLVATMPRTALDADGLDGMLGALSALVDETFEGLVRTGFAIPDDVSVTPPPQAAVSHEG